MSAEKLLMWCDRAHESSVRVLIAMRNIVLGIDPECSTKTIEREAKNFQSCVNAFLEARQGKKCES